MKHRTGHGTLGSFIGRRQGRGQTNLGRHFFTIRRHFSVCFIIISCLHIRAVFPLLPWCPFLRVTALHHPRLDANIIGAELPLPHCQTLKVPWNIALEMHLLAAGQVDGLPNLVCGWVMSAEGNFKAVVRWLYRACGLITNQHNACKAVHCHTSCGGHKALAGVRPFLQPSQGSESHSLSCLLVQRTTGLNGSCTALSMSCQPDC